MSAEPIVGQAMVTDPVVSGTGGYMLVAASPLVSTEDCEHLAALPQISDYLHLESSPRVFFSFYALPSGSWAFAQRFARGTRRGSLNRIVAHTLVLSEEALEALAWEPRLLSNCSFRTGGKPRSFASLKDWPGDQVPRVLEDLALIPPQDANSQRFELLASRRRFLSDMWTPQGLEKRLAQALGGCGAGGLLLEQTPEHEQLLALTWSVLPRRDRRETPWTTHLAPGSAGLFRLANVPGPEEARAAGASGWSRLRDTGHAGSAAVAKSLVADRPRWLEVASRWYESSGKAGLSLVGNPAQVLRWLGWLEHGGAPADGLLTLKDLTTYLDTRSIDRTAVEDPWERPDELLRLSAATLRNLQRGRANLKTTAGAVLEALQDRGLANVLLLPERFADLAERGTEVDGGTLLAALELALRHTGAQPARQADLLLAALAAARGRNDLHLAGQIAAEYVVAQEAALTHFAPEDVERVLVALHAAPEGLVEALRVWPEALCDRAVQTLGSWAETAQEAALQALAHLASLDDMEIRELPSLPGLCARLARAGASPEQWFPFALAEAAVIDRAGSQAQAEAFASFLLQARTGIVPATARPGVLALCRRLQRGDLAIAAAHRELVCAFATAMALRPVETVAALSQVQMTEADLRTWWPAFSRVAEALDRQSHKGEASQVRRTWWVRMAALPWEGMAMEALRLFDALAECDRKEVAEIWVGKLAQLPRWPGDEAVVAELRRRIAKDPKHQLDLEILDIRARIPRIGLTQALAEIAEKLRFAANSDYQVGSILADELRKKPDERMAAIFNLLLAPRLLPSTRRLVEEQHLDNAMKSAQESLFLIVLNLPLKALVSRGRLLLRVSYRLGEIAAKAPYDGPEFLRQALQLECYDAVGTFLLGTRAAKNSAFLHRLAAKDGSPELAARLKSAARHPLKGWDLRLFLTELENLPV